MRLEWLELENVCQHRSLEHAWHHGLNGIVGPNGSGKSNILKAIRFAITGAFDNAGTKAENVFQLAPEKTRARVSLAFEHEGTRVEVVRVLRRGTSHCRVDGGEQVDGDNATTEAVMDVLGVDQRILSEYIFVPQRRMAGFVDETPAERGRTFGQLFDLARAEAVAKMLDAEVKRTSPAPRSPEIDPLRERVARNRARREELVNTLAAAGAALEQLDPVAARALVARADRWAVDDAAVAAFATQAEGFADDLEARRRELGEAEAEREDLGRARAEAAGDVEAARAALARWEVARERRRRRDALRARREALDAEVAEHPEPRPPADHPGEEVMRTRLAELDHGVWMREDFLARFADRPGVCPTCGTETDVLRRKAAEYEAELPGLKQRWSEAHYAHRAYMHYVGERDRRYVWQADHSRRVANLLLEQEALEAEEGEAPAAGPDACREVVDAGAALDRAIAEADIRINHMHRDYNREEARLEDLDRKIEDRRAALGEAPDPDAVAHARASLPRAEQLEREIGRGEGELGAVTRSFADDAALLARLEEAERRAEAGRLWAYHLGEVRRVLHHDRLPRVVAQNYLEILADDTNDLLESFDADFRVGLGEGLSFAATFLRGPYAGTVSPAQRLSEGQKVVLALAFRVAVNSLFAGAAGLLCLDEPTESLDERNLACLEVAIGTMRGLSESRGLQCLLVTHEPSFDVLFDGVLKLAA